MAYNLLALGDSGARVAAGYVYCAMAGAAPAKETQIILIGASDAQRDALLRLCADYAAIQRHTGMQADTAFTATITATCWPDEAASASLAEQASSGEDALLCSALFTAEQAALEPAHALDASGPVSAMTWASLLLRADQGPLSALAEDMKNGSPCVLTGSLCEPVCAGGAALLSDWLQRHAERKPSASLLLPLYLGDRTDLCKATLLTGAIERSFPALCLTGLPEDCRLGNHGGAHLAEWLAARAAARMLDGLTGQYTWRIPAGAISWSLFGDEEAMMRNRFDALAQSAVLMLTTCAPRLVEAQNSIGWLRDRMTPWYAAYFGDVRSMDDQGRAQLVEDTKALIRLLSRFGGWMRDMTANLPAVCQWADALREGRDAAESHYAQVLEVAGHLAWMEYEAERSGLKDERIVHRYDMSDNEGEAAMRQIEETREELNGLLSEQQTLNMHIGARLTRAMLSASRDAEKAEADRMAAQVMEGRRRIVRAAEIASVDEMSKVETARIRLGRMERHVSMLNGRAERARRDLEIWNGDDRRTLPPTMEAKPTEVEGLYPAALMNAMAACDGANNHDAKKLHQQLNDAWLWTYPPKSCMDNLAKASGTRRDALGDLLIDMSRLPCKRRSTDED